jgi:hypothetical protein
MAVEPAHSVTRSKIFQSFQSAPAAKLFTLMICPGAIGYEVLSGNGNAPLDAQVERNASNLLAKIGAFQPSNLAEGSNAIFRMRARPREAAPLFCSGKFRVDLD